MYIVCVQLNTFGVDNYFQVQLKVAGSEMLVIRNDE